MVRPEVVRRRLEQLGDYLAILERYRRYDLEAFLVEPERYGSAERFLQLAIEATLDMGSHIIADETLGSVEQSRDIPRRFREHGLLTEDLEERWIRMIGFRNILVHEYLEVDRAVVYDVVCNRLQDLAELRRVFAGFL
ncbi:MAG: DUF86 domain-containing protein [Gammaproteobacteria bacterium]|nr:DUF86 domain-containing protein [Gammaproteobacteria bacterium]